jgi:UDP-glucose 6-dehydrogenase
MRLTVIGSGYLGAVCAASIAELRHEVRRHAIGRPLIPATVSDSR